MSLTPYRHTRGEYTILQAQELIVCILEKSRSAVLADWVFCSSLTYDVYNEKLKEPFLLIELPENAFISMIEEDMVYCMCVSDDVVALTIKLHDKGFPIPRVYSISMGNPLDLFNDRFQRILSRLEALDKKPMFLSQEGFDSKIQNDSLSERLHRFKQRRSMENVLLSEVVEGRLEGDIINHAMAIESEGCLICKENNTTLCSTQIGDIMIWFKLCETHKKEAENRDASFLEYISQHFGYMPPISSKYTSKQELFMLIKEELPVMLDAKLIKVNSKKYQLTLIRKSGITLIVRLTDPLNYAYMIKLKESDRSEIFRIDSAQHHNDILRHAPDHYHIIGHGNDNDNIHSSFTTGNPLLDAKRILNEIARIENEIN